MIQPDLLPLRIKNLKKRFGTFEALRGVSFELRHGERLAFLGTNGAGKTTMIRALAGRTKPTGGSIEVFGDSARSVTAKRAIGFVPQEIALYGDLTTRENLVAFAKFHGVRRGEISKRVDWALQWTGLHDRSRDLVRTFSGGMKRRVNLACGVMHEPRVLLLDEPTVGVDPQSRERIFAMLDELSAGGTSLLLTTHHLDEAQQRSDRIVILDGGQVVADGTIDELVHQTIGSSRLVKVRLDRPMAKAVRYLHQYNRLPAEQLVGHPGSAAFETRIESVTDQLTPMLEAIQRDGYRITDMELQTPSLHHVFLSLTGNELRD
ncbi:ABC transporter ATP-binding protein [Roseiconus lacunae]|uniref:ABC transporter ATP-binding protein n=1 Tax=Roseiconus lacunae TaxID=2605694 RepID=UPI00308EC306|nr:ABC transporter ATP-binding protein [Stieleria sp. HD01]